MLPNPTCRTIYSLKPVFPSTVSLRFYQQNLPQCSYSTKPVVTTPPTTSLSSSVQSITTDPSHTVNPPPSTRPPSLSLPTRLPSQPAYRYYFSIGKAYANFYKTGFKNLYRNFNAARAIAHRLSSATYEEDVRKGFLSRAEWHLVRRQRADALRIPLFLVIFMVCGEFTPLVAIFFSGAVPRSLWVPKQVENAREKVERRRSEVFRDPPAGLDIDLAEKRGEAATLSKAGVLHIGRSLGLYSNLWDRIGLPPLWLVRRRVRKRLDFVELDDFTICRDGGVENMEFAEVELAAEMRGLNVLGRRESALRSDLSNWLLNKIALEKQGLSTRKLYLTRPPAWPLHRNIH